MEELPADQIKSMIDDEKMVSTPVNSRIKKICVVNEHQKLFKNDSQIYDVQLTRGIIFETEDGLEVSLEKDVWFSEMIIVCKGYKLISNFSSPSEFEEDWENEYRGECTRDMITIQ